MTNQSSLLVSTEGKITTITLNRPDKCNALDGHLVQQLQDALFSLLRDDTSQVILLKGNGNHFCAGADIEWMKKLAQVSFQQSRDDARGLAALLYRMYSFPKPIVTLAQGSILGGGLGLLACSDVVITSEEATFCFSESKIGLIPAVVSPYIISVLGEHAARYYFLTAEKFNAAEAYRLGLAHHVVSQEMLMSTGLSLAKNMLNNSPAALAEIKRLLPLVVNQEISLELSEKTAEILAKMRVSEQAQEGLSAFLDKRSPTWR